MLKRKEGMRKLSILERFQIWLGGLFMQREEEPIGPKRKLKRREKREKHTSLKKVRKYKRSNLDTW